MNEKVVLVSEKDEELGLMEKQQAHLAGLLHRAISVFVFNSKNELMIQQRALHKYHSPGLWTNTCCSHPRQNESYQQAAERRLQEEMGFECDLEYSFDFIYKADVGGGLIEHEIDHVFVGRFEGKPSLNPEEVADYKWVPMNDLLEDIERNPEEYTTWFKIILNQYLSHIS